MPFIIFLQPVSCDGSNRLWRQRLLLSPCFLWRHKQTLFGVIRPLADGKCRMFRRRVIERFCFHRYLCFYCVRILRSCFLYIVFFMNRVTISYWNCIHSNSTLNHVCLIYFILFKFLSTQGKIFSQIIYSIHLFNLQSDGLESAVVNLMVNLLSTHIKFKSKIEIWLDCLW